MWTFQIYAEDQLDHYVDGCSASRANWMRFVNCASTEDRQNVVACQYRGQIYYQLLCQIDVGVELFVWYGEDYAEELGLFDALVDDEAEDTTLPALSTLPRMLPSMGTGCCHLSGGELIDFDDVSVVVDGFWSGCRDQFLICRLYHTFDIQSRH